MPGGLEQQVTPCKVCGFNDVTNGPNFEFRERIAYREVGNREQHNYSRETFMSERVLVCVSCGEVHEVLSKAF
jgi:hypothetical protein